MKSALEKAKSLAAGLRTKLKRARARVAKLERELWQARSAVTREAIKLLIGHPVKTGTWVSRQCACAWQNDEVGTLLKVNRKYGVIDYQERGKWNIPLHDIIAAEVSRTAIAMDALAEGTHVDEWCAAPRTSDGHPTS